MLGPYQTNREGSMLSEEWVAALHRDGYVNGGQALDDQEVEELREELARVI